MVNLKLKHSQEIQESFVSLLVNLIGNFFPFWWGWMFLHFIASWHGWNDLGKITDLLIIAASFFTSSCYLLYRNRKDVKWHVWLILFLGALINSTLFTLYSLKDKILKNLPFASDLNQTITWILLILSIFLLGYIQYKENVRISTTNAHDARDASYNNLEDKFNSLRNG